MKTYQIKVTRTLKRSGIVRVRTMCQQESKNIARQLAAKQDAHCYIDGDIVIDEVAYSRIKWEDSEKPTYQAEVLVGNKDFKEVEFFTTRND